MHGSVAKNIVGSWCLLAWLGLAVCGFSPKAEALEYQFKGWVARPPVSLGPAVLSDAERQFLAGLPEIRVALQKVGAPPYENVAANGDISGFQAEMLAHLSSTFGLKIKPVVFADWPSVLRAVREGEADMVLTLGVTADRLKYLEFTLGTVPVPVGLLGLKGNVVTLNGARIALEREYQSNDLVRRQYPLATVLPVGTTIEALRAVAQGRADYYVGSLLEAIDTLSRNPVPGIEVREILQTGAGQYHFGVRKDWAPLAAILNKGITRFRADAVPRTASAGLTSSASASGTSAPADLSALAVTMVMSPEEASLIAQRSVWRVGAVRNLTMLNEVDERGMHSGIAAEYTEHLARRAGVGLQIVPFDNVAAMLDSLRAGRIDFIPFLTRTPEREREFVFSKPYFEMPYLLVARVDAPMYWDLGSLRGKRLALAAQHPLRPVLAQRFAQIEVIDARDGNDAMDMVARGDADAAVEVKNFANLRINSDPAARLRVVGAVNELPAQFSFATAVASVSAVAGLMPLVNRALDDISPVERERMLRRWVAIDLNPSFQWRRHLPVILVSLASLLTLAALTLWWTRRLAREVQARRRADEQLEDIGRSVPGVAFRVVLDDDMHIQRSFFSAGTDTFLGLQTAVSGKTVAVKNSLRDGGPDEVLAAVQMRMRPAQADAARSLLQSCLQSSEPAAMDFAYAHPDGRTLWLHAQAVCKRTPEGEAVWTGYAVDVSAEHQLQDRLTRETAQREMLLASASHELRAPTHTLSLALQHIADETLPAISLRSMRIARDAARTLSQLLNDVLDVARFQTKHLELRPQDFDLREVINQVREAHAQEAQRKHLNLEVSVGPEVPSMVFLDPLRLKQVLTNLIGNAIEFTEHGGVALHVSASASGSHASMLEFVVQDSGVGMSPDMMRRVFEPLTRGAGGAELGTASPASSHAGLGLSICRRLVQMMNGTIVLESQTAGSEGGHSGTTARVTIPATGRHSTARPVRSTGIALVCDDDAVSRMFVAEALTQSGYRVVEVGDGEEALQRWRQGDVRLLVTDLSMPGLGGLSLIAVIRSEEADRTERTGIVVCSGDMALPTDTPSSKPAAPQHDAFLSKPLDLRNLNETLLSLGLQAETPPTRGAVQAVGKT
jgi:two-component system, NarL family, sensor histidine kinase EvgS